MQETTQDSIQTEANAQSEVIADSSLEIEQVQGTQDTADSTQSPEQSEDSPQENTPPTQENTTPQSQDENIEPPEPETEVEQSPEVDSNENAENTEQENTENGNTESENSQQGGDSSQEPPIVEPESQEPDTEVEVPQEPQPDTQSPQENTELQPQKPEPIFPNEPLAPLPPQIPQVDTPLDKESNAKLEAFLQELHIAIETNESVLSNTHFSLQGIAQLLEVSKDIWEFYSYQCANLKLNNEQFNLLKETFNTISVYISNTLKELYTIHNTSLNIFKSTEALLDEAKNSIDSINGDVEIAKETLNQIQNLEQKLESIKTINATLTATIAQAEAMKNEINALVPNILNEVKAELLREKESHELELEQKKAEFLTIFSEKIAIFEQKVTAFNEDFVIKQTHINEMMTELESCFNRLEEVRDFVRESLENVENAKNEALQSVANAKSEIEDKANECVTTMESAKTQCIESVESTKDNAIEAMNEVKTQAENAIENAKTELEAQKQTHLNELDSAKDTHLSTLGEATQNHSKSLSDLQSGIQDDFNQMAENMKQELDAVGASQIADLTTIVNEIKSKQTALGHNFQHQNFTANGTFTKPQDAQYFYVFVQGGIGASFSTTAGGISSFGALLSANGGSGSEQGAGQKGDCKGAFVEIVDETTPVVVGQGGIVMVSWSNRG
ncbi:hypothetical protein [Helicobacter cinaedi]|uniref:Massive surface protein MspC n=2 Tax=Helicobacter cinaedi TaxID=213 RepID=A0A377JWN1_9HELI|nr:hypothetical protein [Helicobacter cinaedi]STP13359.1 massive surface protein MspC [Helicobacter cinaedi]STP13773.1 massive surface protein MspC [Helicobacter cinaedi]STP13789.1 massive surface protein MspC [Helicobacter cinaedi]